MTPCRRSKIQSLLKTYFPRGLFLDRFYICFNSQNMLELHVYFQELNYQLVEQIPAYDSESLLGKCK